jgi:acyl phosphate:glycerol-3-phosphate acyltransferase
MIDPMGGPGWWWPLLLGFLLAYLLGSIPSGFVLTRWAGLGDIRKIGSGNIGATNVLRTGRKGLAIATLLFDLLKGAIPTFIAWRWFGPDMAVLAGAGAFLGHCFPVWLGFKGGKGVAVFIGLMLGLCWPVGLVFCAVWLVIAFAQRYSSLAALTAAVTSPIFAYVAGLYDLTPNGEKLAAVAAVLALILVYKHRANIGRLINGTEPKIGSEKKAT